MSAKAIDEVAHDLLLLAGLLSMHDKDHPKYNRADILRDVMTEAARDLRRHSATLTAAQQQGQAVVGLREGNWSHPDGGRIVGWVVEPDDVERMGADAFCLPREVAEALAAMIDRHRRPIAAPPPSVAEDVEFWASRLEMLSEVHGCGSGTMRTAAQLLRRLAAAPGVG